VNARLNFLKAIELSESFVTDEGLKSFIVNCPNLEEVCIDRTDISDELIPILGNNFTFKQRESCR
jgi:hypothetical protein